MRPPQSLDSEGMRPDSGFDTEPEEVWTRRYRRTPIPCPHPDRPRLARGACRPCYEAWRKARRERT